MLLLSYFCHYSQNIFILISVNRCHYLVLKPVITHLNQVLLMLKNIDTFSEEFGEAAASEPLFDPDTYLFAAEVERLSALDPLVSLAWNLMNKSFNGRS